MKIAVLGAGAMGSIYASLLSSSSAGHEVWAVDTWADHIAAINGQGLIIENHQGDKRIFKLLKASTSLEKAGSCDLYIIATKADQVGKAAQAIAPFMTDGALILTIQNGLGAGERIQGYINSRNVLLGVADGFGASMKGAGHVYHAAMNLIRIGEMNGGLTDRLLRLEDLWQNAGFNAQAYEDINQLIWEKFLCNVTLSAPCTIFNCTVGELKENSEYWQIALGCMLEAYEVGRLKRIKFSFDNPVAYVTSFAEKVSGARPSMLQDHLNRRRSEIGAINGQVPILAQEIGIEAPYNKTLTTIILQREMGFDL